MILIKKVMLRTKNKIILLFTTMILSFIVTSTLYSCKKSSVTEDTECDAPTLEFEEVA